MSSFTERKHWLCRVHMCFLLKLVALPGCTRSINKEPEALNMAVFCKTVEMALFEYKDLSISKHLNTVATP